MYIYLLTYLLTYVVIAIHVNKNLTFTNGVPVKI